MAFFTNLFGVKVDGAELSPELKQAPLPSEQAPIAKAVMSMDEKVSIAIGNTSLKAIGFSVGSHSEIIPNWHEEIFMAEFENKKPGEVVKNISEALPKALNKLKQNLEGRKSIAVSIPVDGAFLKNITIPKVPEVEKLLQAEAKKYIPIPFEEILFAGNVVHEDEKSITYFTVGIQKSILDGYRKAFTAINITPYFEIDIFSSARVLPQGDAFNILVDMGATHTTVICVKNQIVHDTISIPHGTNELTNKLMKDTNITFSESFELLNSYTALKNSNLDSSKILHLYIKKFSEDIAKEVHHILLGYERQYNSKITDVYFVGGGSTFEDVGDEIVKSFGKDINAHFPIYSMQTGEENFWNNNYRRYAQCFGLAQKYI